MDAHVMKIKGLNKLDVGNKTLVLTPETRKKNPNILRFLLGFIINVEFGGIREKAAERLGSLGDVYASRRSQSGMNSLSYSVIGDILNDRSSIAYWHLEPFARHLKIPAGAIVLLSRFLALVRDDRIDNAKQVAAGLRCMADVLDSIGLSGELTHNDLKRIAAGFEGAVAASQSNLFRT